MLHIDIVTFLSQPQASSKGTNSAMCNVVVGTLTFFEGLPLLPVGSVFFQDFVRPKLSLERVSYGTPQNFAWG